jgi:hypothetical protein
MAKEEEQLVLEAIPGTCVNSSKPGNTGTGAPEGP